MSWSRVIAYTGKELRELRWMAFTFFLLSMATVSFGVAVRDATFFTRTAVLLELLVVAALYSALLAERQGFDLSTGTRRHLLSFPLQPLEVVAGKGLAFLLSQLLLLALGIGAFTVTTHIFTPTSVEVGTFVTVACRILLLSLVCWSLELAVVSWPRLGLAVVLTLVAVYVLGLVYVPFLRQNFNVAHLILVWVEDAKLLGPAIAAVFLTWSGVITTALGVAVRPMEQ